MNRIKCLLGLVVMLGCTVAFATPAEAHSVFKKQLAKKYPGKKISCNACHVDKKPKSERNNFGKLFSKTFENKKLTEEFKSKKGAEKKEYEAKTMAPAFDKAYEKIKAMTFHDLLEAGVIEGVTDADK